MTKLLFQCTCRSETNWILARRFITNILWFVSTLYYEEITKILLQASQFKRNHRFLPNTYKLDEMKQYTNPIAQP